MSEQQIFESVIRTAKRTRICVSQSKYGCYTCKRRRIKCDEDKPKCQRCVRSTIECEGYPEKFIHSRAATKVVKREPLVIDLTNVSGEPFRVSAVNLAPSYTLIDRCRWSSAQERLARVGVNLLSQGRSDQFDFTIKIFDELLPQLSYTVPSVNAAASALGAIYELQSTACSTDLSDRRNATAATQYGFAIKAMQEDLLQQQQQQQQQHFDTLPLLMICMLLACSELLLRRRSYSLMHVQAGFKLLEERRAMHLSASSLSSDSIGSFSEAPAPIENDMFLLFRTFDIHSSTYADRRTPTTPPSQLRLPPMSLSKDISPQIIGLDIISTIHSCLYFISNAGQYKYLSAAQIPSQLFIEQGRYLGIMNAWLARLDRYMMYQAILQPSKSKPKWRTHLLMLRNMCLSTIVVATTILSSYETAWDKYSWYFEEIVLGAEEIFAERARARSCSPGMKDGLRQDKTYSSGNDFAFTFTPSPGVIQPLFLTASKYRHTTYRRRAAELIRTAGREGPWIGELVAAVADRLIEVEESNALPVPEIKQLLWDDISILNATSGCASIPESARISGVGMDAPMNRNRNLNDHDSKNWTARRSGETRVRFFKCKDVEGMLEAGLGVGPGNPWSNKENVDDGSPNSGRPIWKDGRFWEDWTEVVKF